MGLGVLGDAAAQRFPVRYSWNEASCLNRRLFACPWVAGSSPIRPRLALPRRCGGQIVLEDEQFTVLIG
jgi:hypothetical protein